MEASSDWGSQFLSDSQGQDGSVVKVLDNKKNGQIQVLVPLQQWKLPVTRLVHFSQIKEHDGSVVKVLP